MQHAGELVFPSVVLFSAVTVMLNISEHSRPTSLTFLLCSFYVLNCLATVASLVS